MAKQTFTTGQVLTSAQMTSLQQTAMGGGSTTDKTTSYVLVAADAGTTVIMNAAGATTITVNTALFAAGDTVNIQNIGAGICTITAGTATVNTAGSLALNQYEGGVLYFRSTSASTFFDYVQTGSVSPLTTKGDLYGYSTLDARVPIGTNNQVLTADSAEALGLKWATPTGSAASFTLLGTGTLTGNTTITVSSISGQNQIYVIVKGASASANAGIHVRFNGDTASNYKQYGNYISASSAYSAGNFVGIDYSGNRIDLAYLGTDATSVAWGGLLLQGCNGAGKKMFNNAGSASAPSGSGQVSVTSFGLYDSASTISSVSLFSSNGNFDAGTFDVYGSA